MELYLAKDKEVVLYQDIQPKVSLEQGEIIPRDFKDGRSAVDTTNPQYVKLKECIGSLKNSEVGNCHNPTASSCAYCGYYHCEQVERVSHQIIDNLKYLSES